MLLHIFTILTSFPQIVLITTVHGWATVWARGTTDTSTCSPCLSPCSPSISSPLTLSTWSCVSILWNQIGEWYLKECDKTGRTTSDTSELAAKRNICKHMHMCWKYVLIQTRCFLERDMTRNSNWHLDMIPLSCKSSCFLVLSYADGRRTERRGNQRVSSQDN